MIQRRVFAQGRVQGVSYRASTAKKASQFRAMKGWVRNLSDGRVEAVFCGPEKDVLAMVEWCRKGPVFARVDELTVQEEPVDPALSAFQIASDS